jgi:aspartate/methionine/tyrosine aminotransferase
MFSARTRWDLRANRLEAIRARKRERGEAIVDLTESNPTSAGIDYPNDLLVPLAEPGGLRYEPLAFGAPRARGAVAEDFSRRGCAVDPSRILLTASTSEAYAFLFKLLCDPGDEVLVPRPGYPLFEYLAGLESVRPVPYPLVHDGEWHVELEALREAASARTRMVVVVSPHNPAGAYLKCGELEALESFCAERSLALVSDEVFADYPLRPDPRRAGSVARDGPALSFALGGLSKSCGLPQLKLSWIAVTGPESLRSEALARLEVVSDAFLSVGTPVQRALPALLARRAELQRPIAERVASNLASLRAHLPPGCPASLLEPEGGWYAVLRVPATLSEAERVEKLLEERNVLVHPGYFFDFPREAYLVLSLLPRPGAFDAGVERILETLVL